MSILKHIKEHAMLGIAGDVLTVGDGGDFATLQAAVDSVTLADTYTSTAGAGTITTWNQDSRNITGSGSSFNIEFSGFVDYFQIAGENRAYLVEASSSTTSLTTAYTRVESNVSASPAYSIIKPSPKHIKLISDLDDGAIITGALGFFVIDFNGYSVGSGLFTHLESGCVWLDNWKGNLLTEDAGSNGYGILSAGNTAINGFSGTAPDRAILDYRLTACQFGNAATGTDLIYVSSSGTWVITGGCKFVMKSSDLMRLGARGSVDDVGTIYESGSKGGSTIFKHDLGGEVGQTFLADHGANIAKHQGSTIKLVENSGSAFIGLSTIADLEYRGATFEVFPGASTLGKYISSNSMNGATSSSMTIDFYDCNIVHQDGVSSSSTAIGLGLIVTNQTCTLRFHNSDVFPGNDTSNGIVGTWTVTAEHYGSRGGQVDAGAANYTAQMQHIGKTIIFDTGAANRTLTLPPARLCKYGKITAQKSTSEATNQLIIDGDGAETINGTATVNTTSAYGAITVECDGTEWRIINSI